MPSSALSDALNEFAAPARRGQAEASTSGTPQLSHTLTNVVHPQSHRLPGPSDVSLFPDCEAANIVASPPAQRKASVPSVHAVHELLRVVCATREAQEIERKRRLAWEQEQEAKSTQRQAQMERQMFEMRQEIASLRAMVKPGPTSSGMVNMPFPSTMMQPLQPHTYSEHPVSPLPLPQNIPNPMPSQDLSHLNPFSAPTTPLDVHSLPPQPLYAISPTSLPDRHKRRSPSQFEDTNDDASDSDTESSTTSRPAKRHNHHDSRCLTIHSAMRRHTIRLMGLDSDKHLPDTHPEGAPLEPGDLVRFIWEKTTKQSVHNGRMKQRVIDDLKANRNLYKHVPDKDFRKTVLESAFDQCFTTFRQKYKSQRDSVAAAANKKREDAKAQKSRRLARRRTKLDNRVNARMRDSRFEHAMFDGAFQLECMSEEESDTEPVDGQGVLRTLGLPWRSKRLLYLYELMDHDDRETSSNQPKRGVGRKDRIPGPSKEGLIQPPSGISAWMISKIWLSVVRTQYPDIDVILRKVVIEVSTFDPIFLLPLGEEEEEPMQPQVVHRQNTSYYTNSLQYALV